MNQEVTLQVSDNIWHYAQSVAKKSKRRIEEVLADWLEKGSHEIEVEKLSDAEIIALAELKMPVKQQKVLHNLIARNREGELTTDEKTQLDEMMEDYEIALLRKSQAMRVAVERGLMKPYFAQKSN